MRMNGTRKICLAMAGDSPGRTIAASFITGRRRVRMARPGASARSWSGGMNRRRNGLDWIILTTRRTWRQLLLTS